jgi:hypothetical protein
LVVGASPHEVCKKNGDETGEAKIENNGRTSTYYLLLIRKNICIIATTYEKEDLEGLGNPSRETTLHNRMQQ